MTAAPGRHAADRDPPPGNLPALADAPTQLQPIVDLDATQLRLPVVDLEATQRLPEPVPVPRTPAGKGGEVRSRQPAQQVRSRQPSREPRSHRRANRAPRHRTPDGVEGPVPPGATISESGELVVPLRPVRTREGYRSVYSELTRFTARRALLVASRAIGEGLITFGLVVLLFAAYEVWGVGAKVNEHQSQLNDQLAQDWNVPQSPVPTASASTPPPPMDGNGFARLYIPRISDKSWVLVQGVQPDDIRYAPGHDPGTAMPGEIGNMVIAGHRSPAIFWDLDLVQVGDPIVVETRGSWFVYKVTRSKIVPKTGVQILDPNPENPGAPAEEKMMTVFTCYPKTGNSHRLVLHARLDSEQPHDAGYPPALGR